MQSVLASHRINYLALVALLQAVTCLSQHPIEIAISIFSGTTTNTSVTADFKCKPTSGLLVHEISGKFNLPQTFVPCTGLKSLVQRYVFNMSSVGGKREPLVIKDLRTVSLFVNGEQIATQSGPIDSGLCRSGKVVMTHWFRSREPFSCSTAKGLTHIESPSSTLRISGGNCEVFCSGKFTLDYLPGLKNSKIPGLDIPLTIRPLRIWNNLNIG